MPSTAVRNSTNISALIRVGSEFSFSSLATSVATARAIGFTPFGNIVDVTPNVTTTKVEHISSNRGAPRKDREDITKSTWEFKIKSDEFNLILQKLLLGGTTGTDFIQSTTTGITADTFAFNTTAAVIGNWYDITISGVRVRNITTLTIASIAEGTDFVVDLPTGRVMFLTAQANARVPTVTATAMTIAAGSGFVGIKPGQQVKLQGFGRLLVFDQDTTNGTFADYCDFSCQLTLDTASAWNATSFSDLTFTCLVTDTVGNWLTRAAINNVSVA